MRARTMMVADRKGRVAALKVGDRVAPKHNPRVSYGYVRAIIPNRAALSFPSDPLAAVVYWPEIRSAGDGWMSHNLIRL